MGLSIANAASEITDEQYIRTYNYIFNKWANGCSCEPDCGCIFRYTNLINLESKIKLLNNVYIHHAVPIEVTVTDSKYNGTGPFDVGLYVAKMDGNVTGNNLNYTLISSQRVNGLNGRSSTTLSFNWTPTEYGNYTVRALADTNHEVNEVDEGDNNADDLEEVKPKIMHMELLRTEALNSSADPSGQIPRSITYYFKADYPILIETGVGIRTPTFLYATTDPVYSPNGTVVFYPYGAIWQYYGDSSDGPWHALFSNPYVTCSANTTNYNVTCWGSGGGYHQYFAIHMMTHGSDYFGDGLLKTKLAYFGAIENDF